MKQDNIFALSTADMASAICVFRLSGPDVLRITQSYLKKEIKKEGYVYYRDLIDPMTQEKIDSGIIFYKQNPKALLAKIWLKFNSMEVVLL